MLMKAGYKSVNKLEVADSIVGACPLDTRGRISSYHGCQRLCIT